ncbi:TPA: transcriptional regulator, partial [Staphylococcus aureus]|nr:transcriptional regulator [Staphylococcus aureus]
MNLEFNIAVHVLAFLTKHHSEKFNSSSLAELT